MIYCQQPIILHTTQYFVTNLLVASDYTLDILLLYLFVCLCGWLAICHTFLVVIKCMYLLVCFVYCSFFVNSFMYVLRMYVIYFLFVCLFGLLVVHNFLSVN